MAYEKRHPFEELVQQTFRHEVLDASSDQHPAIEELLDFASGTAHDSIKEDVSIHLIGCESCRHHVISLQESFLETTERLNSQASIPKSFSEFCAKQESTSSGFSPSSSLMERIRSWLRPQRRVAAWIPAAAAVAAAALTVAILLPSSSWLDSRSPTITQPASDVKDVEITTLPDDFVPPLSVEGVSSVLAHLDEVPLSRSFVMLLGYLNQWGLPLSGLSTIRPGFQEYITTQGDTWKSIAGAILLNEDLWPVIALINSERLKSEPSFPTGIYLRIPLLQHSESTE